MMGAIKNLNDLTDYVNSVGKKVRAMSEAMEAFGESFGSYMENDIKATLFLYICFLPNNEKKRLGIPMHRSKAYRKARRNERCYYGKRDGKNIRRS